MVRLLIPVILQAAHTAIKPVAISVSFMALPPGALCRPTEGSTEGETLHVISSSTEQGKEVAASLKQDLDSDLWASDSCAPCG